jgi:hypothetical protein
MKKIFKIVVLALALATTPLLAGAGAPGHSHEKVTEQKAIKIATSMKDGLADKGTLDKSWKNVNTSKIIQKKFKGNMEWVVTFNNPKIEDKAKQTLYVFVSLYGQVTGANYTGN